MNNFVVDANVIGYFQQERLHGEGKFHAAMEAVQSKGVIALDDAGHCKQEWLDCAAGAYPLALADWISDKLVEQKIVLFQFCDENLHQQLTKLGIPKDDHKWIRLAIGAPAVCIFSEDIDLFSPQRKNSSKKERDKIKSNCGGPVPKYMKRKHGISVICEERVSDFCDGL